jgi:hypothetical protein
LLDSHRDAAPAQRNLISFGNPLALWVARLPWRVQTKLLLAFLTIVALLIVLGAVGTGVLSGVNTRTTS